MSDLIPSYLDQSGEETRLVVETLRQVVPGLEVIAVVTFSSHPIPGLELSPLVAPSAETVFELISAHVRESLRSGAELDSFTQEAQGVEWGVLVEPIKRRGGMVVAAFVVARQGRTWSTREESLVGAFASLLSRVVSLAIREDALLHQRRLDELVAQVAERLMSASAANRQEVLDWVTKVLAEFLGADVAFIRRNDLVRETSILEAEWPVREDKPDPDPLYEVRFDADPIFMATRELRTPYLTATEDVNDDYRERALKAAKATPAAGAAVPLLLGDQTWGVLGFIHFNSHDWVSAEVNALQAVASMLVQLQARFQAEERTLYNANHDELTGLPNRRALLHEMRTRLEEGRAMAVMVIDLDRFKVMNDYLGHGNGDRLLVTIADRIRTSIRAKDFAARLGGDEFVFIVDSVTSEIETLAVAYRILDLIARSVVLVGQEVSHTASIGIVLAQGDESELDLLGFADVAMYSAKARGRNQAVVFNNELRERVNLRSRTELLLREAIEQGGLRLYYQPEVDLRTGRMLAVEALVRWEHPTRGLLAAAEFIDIAEETGLVAPIGRWVFATACVQMREWRHARPDDDFIMRINMSPAEFKMDDLVDFVASTLRENGVPGNRVCIEITEHAVMDEPGRTQRILHRLRALGVIIALDDFGTGFASMTELKNLPIDLLKLDMSFVRGVATDEYDRAIVESLIRLGGALDIVVVAEGVESTAIVAKLLELGCHRGQGHLISMAVPPEALAAIMDSGGVEESLLDPVELWVNEVKD